MSNEVKNEQHRSLGLSSEDATTLTRVSFEAVKTGVTAAVFFNGSVEAALCVNVAANLSGLLLERRQNRLVELVRSLSRKVQALPQEAAATFQRRFDSEEGQQFFETAWEQAAKTVDPAKLDAVASLIKNSLSFDELEIHQAQWLLQLLDELDLVEIILLQSHTEKYRDDETFFEQHKTIFESSKEPEQPRHPRAVDPYGIGFHSTQPMTDEEAQAWEKQGVEHQIAKERHSLHISRVNHLIDMGLLGSSHYTYSERLELTPLGAALLKVVDLADDNEWGQAEQMNITQVQKKADKQSEGLRRSLNQKEEQLRKQRESDEQNARQFIRGLEQGLRNYR